ncbi:MAG: Maf family protein [bacterium]
MKVILASSSPRRQQLMKQMGLCFEVVPSTIDEDICAPGLFRVPSRLAVERARCKALDVSSKITGEALIVGADTIVVLGEEILGKPADAQEAEKMLKKLSGAVHTVITGLAVVRLPGLEEQVAFSDTKVSFRHLQEDEIQNYIRSGEPLDKAGAYGIQGKGALMVRWVNGCFFNVMGLPIGLLGEMLEKLGLNVFQGW